MISVLNMVISLCYVKWSESNHYVIYILVITNYVIKLTNYRSSAIKLQNW